MFSIGENEDEMICIHVELIQELKKNPPILWRHIMLLYSQ